MTVIDVDEVLDRVASIDLNLTAATTRQRRNNCRVFHRLVEQLPAGAVDRAWELDRLTVEQHTAAVRWRLAQGLDP